MTASTWRASLGKKSALPEVDPLSLPVGMCVGPWRVLGWGGRGSYGTIYRVERVGREREGSFALKLAIYPGDERFQREAWLLSHIHSPHVPQLYAQGVWEHRRGAFPFLVMEWVEGESLYYWSARHNPTARQLLEKLVQVALALEATHAVGGVHRDVKGDNVWVRVDGQVFLMDFGAGHYRGAATLTTKLLPPSTPAYRSPEAWGFLRLFRQHPTAHYPASASDDLFALGVMAYRVVTDEYPAATDPEEPGEEVWREGGPGPRPPREINPRLSAELEAVILRLLAIAPIRRFEGRAGKAVEALEQLAQRMGPDDDLPMFPWADEHRPGVRSPSGVERAEEWDAAVRKDFERSQTDTRARAAAAIQPARALTFARAWRVGVAVAGMSGMLAMMVVRGSHQEQAVTQATPGKETQEDGRVAVGDNAKIASAAPLAPESQRGSVSQSGKPLPEKPLPGQRSPPCKPNGEVELRGGCWNLIGNARPPCEEYAYEWNGACYRPLFSTRRQPAADSP